MQGVGNMGHVATLPRGVSRRSVTMMTKSCICESAAPTPLLLLAFELGQRSWKLGFSMGMGQRPRLRQIPAGAVDLLAKEIIQAKARLALPSDAAVISCYEAGRD